MEHHSSQRIDIASSMVFHPLETAVSVVILLFVTVIALGLDPLAAAITGYLFTFASSFKHWNVRTPLYGPGSRGARPAGESPPVPATP